MIEELEFTEWPKTARLNRDMIVTEKIDGSNAAVRILNANAVMLAAPSSVAPGDQYEKHVMVEDSNGSLLLVGAQSRKKLITPGKQTDNFGFAQFVFDNAQTFADTLGEGVHFGEWYGPGIQRGYGIPEKRFMLFNTSVWGKPETRELLRGRFDGRVEASTVLYEGRFDTNMANAHCDDLRVNGSVHVPGFMNPEGVIAYHVQANKNFKITCFKDEQPKGIANA